MSIEKMQYMQHALAAALRCGFVTAPNPRVGCAIVKDDKVIGEGFTQAPGGNHAEIQALSDARAKGHDVHGATVAFQPSSGRPCVVWVMRSHEPDSPVCRGIES